MKPLQNSKKSLRTIMNSIYSWSLSSGVATVSDNAYKVQCDKVIEELNELLYHAHFYHNHKNSQAAVIDDIGDMFIATFNLLTIAFGQQKDGVYLPNSFYVDHFYDVIHSSKAIYFKLYSLDSCILEVIDHAHKMKKSKSSKDLEDFVCMLVGLFKDVTNQFMIDVTIKQCIVSSLKEIRGRKYEIKVR